MICMMLVNRWSRTLVSFLFLSLFSNDSSLIQVNQANIKAMPQYGRWTSEWVFACLNGIILALGRSSEEHNQPSHMFITFDVSYHSEKTKTNSRPRFPSEPTCSSDYFLGVHDRRTLIQSTNSMINRLCIDPSVSDRIRWLNKRSTIMKTKELIRGAWWFGRESRTTIGFRLLRMMWDDGGRVDGALSH